MKFLPSIPVICPTHKFECDFTLASWLRGKMRFGRAISFGGPPIRNTLRRWSRRDQRLKWLSNRLSPERDGTTEIQFRTQSPSKVAFTFLSRAKLRGNNIKILTVGESGEIVMTRSAKCQMAWTQAEEIWFSELSLKFRDISLKFRDISLKFRDISFNFRYISPKIKSKVWNWKKK